MNNFNGMSATLCPFYIRESEYSISCEGIVCNSKTIMKFNSKNEKKQHQRLYCFCSAYESCPLYQSLADKY